MSILEDIVGAVSPGSILAKLLGPLFDKVINLIPDPNKRAEIQLEMARLAQSSEFKEIDAQLQIALAQSQINLEEAKSADRFKSWWRPAAGWCCVLGLVGQLMIGPTLTWFMNLIGHPTPFPQLNTELLTTLLVGMLGLGTLRSYDKAKGTTRGE